MDSINEVEALALAAGIMYRKRHKETSTIAIALATDIVLKQEPDAQPAFMSNLERAYKKGKNS